MLLEALKFLNVEDDHQTNKKVIFSSIISQLFVSLRSSMTALQVIIMVA